MTSVLDLLTGFAGELRAAGIPVSLTETSDAAAAAALVPLHDRRAFRDALAATMVKDQAHREAFDVLFDICFAPQVPGSGRPAVAPASAAMPRPASRGMGGDRPLRRLPPEQLRAALVAALQAGDRPVIAAIAAEAVTRYATIDHARLITGRYYVHRTLRSIGFDALPHQLARLRLAGADRWAAEGWLTASRHARELGFLRTEIEAEVRRRLVAASGPATMAQLLRPPAPRDIDILRATPEDLAAMRALLQPLARRLAARMRKRRGRGPLDLRATVRRGLSYGGTLAEPRFRGRRPARPELMILADVSGSVAAFASFTLQLMSAVAAQFRAVRSFVFIDRVAEVTDLLAELSGGSRADHGARAADQISGLAWAVTGDGRSDYGHALETFWEQHGAGVTQRTTVLILGDARSNYRPPQEWVLRAVAARARRVLWLTPEARARWDSGDSVLHQYAPYCDVVAECRNLRQLADFTEQLIDVRRK